MWIFLIIIWGLRKWKLYQKVSDLTTPSSVYTWKEMKVKSIHGASWRRKQMVTSSLKVKRCWQRTSIWIVFNLSSQWVLVQSIIRWLWIIKLLTIVGYVKDGLRFISSLFLVLVMIWLPVKHMILMFQSTYTWSKMITSKIWCFLMIQKTQRNT